MGSLLTIEKRKVLKALKMIEEVMIYLENEKEILGDSVNLGFLMDAIQEVENVLNGHSF